MKSTSVILSDGKTLMEISINQVYNVDLDLYEIYSC